MTSETEIVKKLVDALKMNHLQNSLCYGKEYTTTVLWSRTEEALTEATAYLERISHDK